MNEMPFNNLQPYERSGALKDIFQIGKRYDDFIVKKYANLEQGEKRVIKCGSLSYEISSPDWLDEEPPVGSLEFSQNRKNDFQKLKEHLGDCVVETVFVYGLDENDQHSNFEIQRKISGKSLGNLTLEERKRAPNLNEQISSFAKKSLDMFRSIGWVPDVHADVFRTDNLIVSPEGSLKLIDTDSIFKLPNDLFMQYKDILIVATGLNPELLAILRERDMGERYAGDIEATIDSLIAACQ